MIFVTHVSILTFDLSNISHEIPSLNTKRSATDYVYKHSPTASVIDLSSVTFSVIVSSTSELLRFLERMAASKPTSWVSLLVAFNYECHYHLFPLSICLGTLACDLGFFPLDFGPLRPKSVCSLVFLTK